MNESGRKLTPYFSRLGAWAFSIGTSIGWGSFVVTCNTYLSQAGILGTVFGLLLGMAVILVITHNLCFMMERCPDAGGIYSYGKLVLGYDAGFLIAWLLALTYLAVLWANITSLPLFARHFLGSVFQFGFCYTVFGYDVYLGEVLLSVAAILLIGLLCANSKRITHAMMIVMALVFVGCVGFCVAVGLLEHRGAGFSYSPAYIPDKKLLSQIVRIAVISPWAFIGFENVAHFSEEFRFPVKKIRGVMLWSVGLTTAFYIVMTVLSVSAYPARYASWLDYIRDMGSLSGLESIPAFYAADVYLGRFGVSLLILALLSIVLTSLIGNLTAISRLLFAFGRDHAWTGRLGALNRRGIPGCAIAWTVGISCLIPFLGRTAIGWIVDVTTLGATVIYGFQSDFVYLDAKKLGKRAEMVSGFAGLVLMMCFAVFLLAPKLMSYEAMASESYLLFAAWSLLGILAFRFVVAHDAFNRYGHSLIVWLMLLLLMLMTVMMWVNRETQQVTDESMQSVLHYFSGTYEVGLVTEEEAGRYLASLAQRIEIANARGTLASYFIVMIAGIVMAKEHEQALQEQLGNAKKIGLTDSLTGVKNKHAYNQWEERINSEIDAGTVKPFAVVVCDINNLKIINDTLGHKEGDECIRRACSRICRVFSHSPVFRYGGDEFVALLFGEDYENRRRLVAELSAYLMGESGCRESIAVGMAEYIDGEHTSLLSVFEKADHAMYDRKKQMYAELGLR